ncbi:hypothetical protein AB0J80_05095 [Actinoplanes sp. NPDC049548]|uniref:hypothetical protein n=1 Tax=Actinoplanes sp. NPDC049548 TaxID=3155152 RepID=UPI003439B214
MEILAYVPLILLVAGLTMATFATAATDKRERRRTAARLADIEHKLDAVIAHLGVTVPEPRHPAVEELVRQGRPIHAVRAYREETGADLLTAKQAVDAISARLGG